MSREYLLETKRLPSVELRTPFWSTWLDNAKAKFLLGWRPSYDYKRMIDEAWAYRRTTAIRGWSGIRDRYGGSRARSAIIPARSTAESR